MGKDVAGSKNNHKAKGFAFHSGAPLFGTGHILA